MDARRNPTTAVLAAALALGLAACGGGGASGPSAPPPPNAEATARAVALAEAIRTSGATGGAFDPAVAATHDGTAATVTATEAGADDFVALEDGPAAIAGWTGVRFGRGDTERLVVYTDVAAPEAAAFTPENLNRLREVSGLTGDAIPADGLAIVMDWFPVIRSVSLAAAPPNGSIVHAPTGTDTDLSFTGAFAGAPGTYDCSGSGSGAACSVTLDDGGMPTAMLGAWTFAPDDGATMSVPDYDHLYFGWWLARHEDGVYAFQSVAGAAGFPAGAGNVRAAMVGSATWKGAAAGIWSEVASSGGKVTDARDGEFTAEAELTANFFGPLDAGTVTGEIASFRDAAGEPLTNWRVKLDPAALTPADPSFAGNTRGEVGDGTSGSGSWAGRFHGSDGAAANAPPSHATGRFDLHFPGVHLAGAFAAGR